MLVACRAHTQQEPIGCLIPAERFDVHIDDPSCGQAPQERRAKHEFPDPTVILNIATVRSADDPCSSRSLDEFDDRVARIRHPVLAA